MKPMPSNDTAPATPDTTGAGGTPSRRVRTRFAPSPTGFLHIGALRTALFSWLLARRHGGDFILRIEDTDQARLVPGSLASIIESLRGMGMDYDEGPDKASVAVLSEGYGPVSPDLLPDHGGDFGPYFQSQRLVRYDEVIEQLLNEGKAYFAFETKEELEAARETAKAAKIPYHYDRRYRDLPLDEARARVAKGEPSVVRFKMPVSGTITTVDALRGPIDWDAETQDDFIIRKGDGFPPYHLAAMVDDHDMQISHVLRGEEWISSYPKHVQIFGAMGWEVPVFCHTPSVLGPDGQKLSKRHGAKGIGEYLAEGFLEDALVNFLALVGWSPGKDEEVLPVEELIARFSVEAISVSPGIFDADKLDWMNGVYIRRLSTEELIERALPFLQKAGLVSASPTAEERDYAARVLALEHERLKRLDEAPAVSDFFFPLLPEYQEKSTAKWLRKEPDKTAAYLTDLAAALEPLSDWTDAALDAATREVGARHGRERGDLTHPVRVALSGREVGPGLFEMMAVLGRERVLARLNKAVEIARA
jgi:glutamyl-tRNA synthetase